MLNLSNSASLASRAPPVGHLEIKTCVYQPEDEGWGAEIEEARSEGMGQAFAAECLGHRIVCEHACDRISAPLLGPLSC